MKPVVVAAPILPKIRAIRRLCGQRGLDPWIQVDGGRSRCQIACRAATADEGARVSVDGVDCADGRIARDDDGKVRRIVVTVFGDMPDSPTSNAPENKACSSQ